MFLLDVVDNNMNYQRTRLLFSQRSAEVSFPSRHPPFPPFPPVRLLAVRASLRDDKSARKSFIFAAEFKKYEYKFSTCTKSVAQAVSDCYFSHSGFFVMTLWDLHCGVGFFACNPQTGDCATGFTSGEVAPSSSSV